MVEKQVNKSVLRLLQADVTDIEVDAFVYNNSPDLSLGSGFGTAISVRGGPSVQEELKKLAPIGTGDAVITTAGDMKAKRIIHVVGPRFQEEDTESKLRTTTLNALKLADEKNIEVIAFPPISTGFYAVPLDVCAQVMLETIKEYLEGDTGLKEVVICLWDNREFGPFKAHLDNMN